ncbi:thiamine pyrophosphate-dependent dehydrogenase E1 component subunit alpha [Sphingobium subterraneum]|uniref:Pyruvate dehydrogenase E1 component alpha subunit n=1 Tax=Sphingobium subterraneum TaxID=627688 RepID=A0A841J9R8_9SPHN|nr:thiamine pyrophosphate-dependent dehydrogenase E1 component subunit alpha [Sphingobium subterraneum]MBB6125245.1 pyruvate dehydrogenase E1 component alpha subunit [Sphingobium subterraneum]
MATPNLTQDQSEPWASGQLAMLERMLLIRHAEARLAKTAKEVGLPGGVHLSIGQEATAVGICSQLDQDDWMTSTHRGHGHFLAKGGDVNAMFAEIWGKSTGICKGMGGSMHVADFSKGIIGANGIVGGGLAIATGAALAAQLDGQGRAAVCFFGDGAANQGVFMECLNVANIWNLPAIFVCENNGLSEFTVSSTVTAGELSNRARAFDMPVSVVDGNDVRAVAQAAQEAVARCRRGEGPSYIEATTYRIHGHLEAEDMILGGGTYRTSEEVERWRKDDRDPIARFRSCLLRDGICDETLLEGMTAHAESLVDAAVAFAEEGPPADTRLAYALMGVGEEA